LKADCPPRHSLRGSFDCPARTANEGGAACLVGGLAIGLARSQSSAPSKWHQSNSYSGCRQRKDRFEDQPPIIAAELAPALEWPVRGHGGLEPSVAHNLPPENASQFAHFVAPSGPISNPTLPYKRPQRYRNLERGGGRIFSRPAARLA
jgi:hypothetical protein